MTTLHGRGSTQNITLKEALACCKAPLNQGSNAIGLLYSSSKCQFAKLQDTTLTDSQGQEISLKSVFEARVFNQQCEMRWLNVVDGQGKAVIISEQALDSCLDEDLNLPFIATLEQKYLIWGKKTSTSMNTGWTRLATARIGPLDVPVEFSTGEQVQLTAIEYLAEYDYGNVAVVEERLIALKELK